MEKLQVKEASSASQVQTRQMQRQHHYKMTKSNSNPHPFSAKRLTKFTFQLLLFYLSNVAPETSCQATSDQATTTTTTATTTTTTPLNSSPSPQSAPTVLRPSIETVASELSKKYLNLEHENWRLKSAGSSSLGQVQANGTGTARPAADIFHDSQATSKWPQTTSSENPLGANEPEREIRYETSDERQSGASELAGEKRRDDYRAADERLQNGEQQHQNIDTSRAASSAAPGQARSKQALQQQQQATNRKRKSHLSSAAYRLLNSNNYEENELFQCHQYLQSHSSNPLLQQQHHHQLAASFGSLSSEALLKLVADQQLPCSCEPRASLDQLYGASSNAAGSSPSIWLSCDNVQLIGSHLFSPSPSMASPRTSGNKTSAPNHADSVTQLIALNRFSQRDAGLQVIHSQMFHYMQLYHLISLDLSNNRIRHIKLDAFHGLELKLEHLDLSNNLLGDSRATFASNGDVGRNGNRQVNGRLIFATDELSRLKNLKWLSLRSNQINQLAPNVFVKQQQQQGASDVGSGSMALSYLDLSDNLLKFVPSDSIKSLDSLERLSLARNRIARLDGASKFPVGLKHLDLSDNLISSVRQCDLIDLANLIELDLSHNQLRQLDQNAFLSARNSLLNGQMVLTGQENSRNSQQDDGSAMESLIDDGFDDEAESSSMRQMRQRRSIETMVATDGDGAVAPGKRLRPTDDEWRANESEGDVSGNRHGDDDDDELEPSESILSAVVSSKLVAKTQSIVSSQQDDEDQTSNLFAGKFNSTLRLNLSNNFLENVPGDSLLKFPNLQQLDLSFNRISRLDSNYFCSIYNLVENLRYLDLSGNLLSLGGAGQLNASAPTPPGSFATQGEAGNSGQASGENARHLNKLFGCLQKLERLLLSANRFGATSPLDRAPGNSVDLSEWTRQQQLAAMQEDQQQQQQADLAASASDDAFTSSINGLQASDRLIVKFGESFGSRHLKVLDLSDNQLRFMPEIQQVSPGTNANQHPNQNNGRQPFNATSQLSQWMSSRIQLEELNLSLNHIERLDEHDFSLLFSLRNLLLDYNKLSSLPSKLTRRFTNLERISLNGNRLSSLEPLNELFELSLKSLKYLNLANNRLVDWPLMSRPIMTSAEAGASASSSNFNQEFRQNNQQQSPVVDVNHPGAQTVTSLQLLAIEELNLDGNLLGSSNVTTLFDQLIHMKSLKTLNLSNNLINKVRSEWFKFANGNLQALHLSGNRINSIDLGSFAMNQVNELLELNLDSNLLKELKRKTFDSLPKIRELNLANNMIHTINSETFHQINSLQVLKLNNNKLTSWKCEYFSNLCNSLSGNINADITTLLDTTGPMLTITSANGEQRTREQLATNSYVSSLQELDLSYNSLSQLRVNSISVHTKLVKLNLEHNKLSFIPHDLFKATTSASTLGRQIQLASSLRYINLAHNRIQTIDNINFRPLKNLISINLSHNELQTLGADVLLLDSRSLQQEQNNRRIVVSNNLTDILMDDDELFSSNRSSSSSLPDDTNENDSHNYSSGIRAAIQSSGHWPSLSKLRHLNLANNLITMVNQSILSELSPFAQLNLNLSFNYLDSESLPVGFFTKTSASQVNSSPFSQTNAKSPQTDAGKGPSSSYDLIFTLKLESLDLSHNKLNEFPNLLLENHYTLLESCNLSHNRIQNLIANSNVMIQIKSLNLEFNPLSRESSELILFEQRNARHLNLAATRLYAIQQATMAAEQLTPVGSPMQFKHRLANQTSQLDLIRSISSQINAPYLRHLNLSSNQLVWLAANVFDKMHSLQTLDLSNNQLTRLHLLNNQLAHVSNTLEHLNMNSNLFTNIDANDFSQLSKLRHLDLSSLLSLQKVNCKFLSKLVSLRSLKMFNYPQLRQNLQAKLSQLQANALSGEFYSERLARKLRNELVLSTIGQHCVLDDEQPAATTPNSGQEVGQVTASNQLVWYNLRELELELFNNFAKQTNLEQQASDGTFRLTNELSQFLGPQTRKLSLVGLNLTSISDFALLGITSSELELKISYTSLPQLPLRQIMQSVTKRTRLHLDFRNNNIQTIDMADLQWLDELQQNNQAFQHGDRSSLRLSNNPFRCDCQTRPLWLWLNQRWDHSSESMSSSSVSNADPDQAGPFGDSGPSSSNVPTQSSPLQLKYNAISHTSDMKCYYPQKLRGKLAQHVYYNDLVCKSSPAPTNPNGNSNQRSLSRKRNETTKSSELHYLASIHGANDSGDFDDLEEDEYTEYEARLGLVKLTKFNRYQPVLANYSSYFINSIQVPLSDKLESTDQEGDLMQDDSSAQKHTKRDQHSLSAGQTAGQQWANQQPQSAGNGDQQAVNTRYSKHRPNTHQKHSHFNTLSTLNQLSKSLQGGSARTSTSAGASSKSSFLTESDVMILTLISVAMTVMSFVIISVCFLKYKMDHSESEQILSSHAGKMLLSKALLMDARMNHSSSSSNGSRRNHSGNSTSSNSSLDSGSKNSKKASSESSARIQKSPNSRSCRSAAPAIKVIRKPQHYASQQVLIPMPHNAIVGPAAQNFLMRSPTIRRMHGLATNASDWFKFTLRAYPSGAANRRRRLFLGDQVNIVGVDGGQSAAISAAGSQLTTSQLKQQLSAQSVADSKQLGPLSVAGCPIHAFKAVKRFEDQSRSRSVCIDMHSEPCTYCKRLLTNIQQTKVQYLAPTTGHKMPSGSNQSDTSADSRQTAIASEEFLGLEGSKQTRASSGGGYLPPRLIKALARQLDHGQRLPSSSSSPPPAPIVWLSHCKQNSQSGQQNPQHEQQRFSSSGLYHSRDQQVRSMRTFGFNARSSTTNTIASTKTQQSESDLLSSQIPTVDVDGRFAYQTESQLDTPSSHLSPVNPPTVSSVCGTERGPREEQGDFFIFARDTPTARSEQQITTRFGVEDSGSRPDSTAVNSEIGLVRQAGLTGTNSVLTNDECSRSSSPVAYGFTGLSPSITTVSSTTMTHNQYTVNNPAVDFRNENSTGGAKTHYENQTTSSNPDPKNCSSVVSEGNQNFRLINNRATNNNNQDYVPTMKPEMRPHVVNMQHEKENSNAASPDDHVIISRL